MKTILLICCAAFVFAGCASNQGGAGTTPFTDYGMSSKTEVGPQVTVGVDPVEISPVLRGRDLMPRRPSLPTQTVGESNQPR